MTKYLAAAMSIGVMSVASAHLEAGQQPAEAADASAILDQYCVTCHSDRLETGGLTLETVDLTDARASAERLEKVIRKLRLGAMPPLGMPRPDEATYTGLAAWLETELDRAAAAHPNAGRTETLHRLNRAEYENVIRDLLHIEGLDFSVILPTDDASYGFDNIAGILGMSPTHLERYMSAARNISRMAVGDVTMPASGETYMIPPDLSQDDRLEHLPFGTRGGTLLRRYFPVDAEYVIRFQAHTGTGISEEEPNYIELTVDGERVFFEEMAQKPVAHTGSGSGCCGQHGLGGAYPDQSRSPRDRRHLCSDDVCPGRRFPPAVSAASGHLGVQIDAYGWLQWPVRGTGVVHGAVQCDGRR